MTYPFEEGLKEYQWYTVYVYDNKNDENKSNLLIKSHKIAWKFQNKAVPYRNLNCQQCYSLNSIRDSNANALIPTNDSILIENDFRSDGQVNYLFIFLENKFISIFCLFSKWINLKMMHCRTPQWRSPLWPKWIMKIFEILKSWKYYLLVRTKR